MLITFRPLEQLGYWF